MERWLLAALVIAALIAFGIWWDRYRKRAREQSHIDSLGTSFARLKANPVRLEAIRGTIRKVCVITEEIDHGRRRGTATSYVSFMVTNNDEIVDLQSAEDDVAVEENARWLAEQLDVPFELS
jgi:hypothetical protein